jgi:hypothetical protein
LHRLIRGERIDVRRVGEWIGYFAIDRISLLCKCKLAGQQQQQVCQQNAQKPVDSSAQGLVRIERVDASTKERYLQNEPQTNSDVHGQERLKGITMSVLVRESPWLV